MTPAGTVVSTRFTVRAGPGVTYEVMYNDYPKLRWFFPVYLHNRVPFPSMP